MKLFYSAIAIILFSGAVRSNDTVIPLTCKYSANNRTASKNCIHFEVGLKRSINGVCLFDDASGESSRSWKWGHLVWNKKKSELRFVPKISCDIGIEYKKAPELDSSLKKKLTGKPPHSGSAVYESGKSPTTCYGNISGVGVPVGPKPCSGEATDPNYCRIVENPNKKFIGNWWVHGPKRTVCIGGVAFGDNPNQIQDEELIISDGRELNSDESALKCIRKDKKEILCNGCKNSSIGIENGNKGCCRRISSSWYQNTLDSTKKRPNGAPTLCPKLVVAKTRNNSASDEPSTALDDQNPGGSSDREAGVTVNKSNNLVFFTEKIVRATLDTQGRLGLNSLPESAYHLKVGGDVLASNFHTPSDRRLKKGISPIPDALEKINRLSGIYYFWDPAQMGEAVSPGRQVGLVAQDVQAVMPELVKEGASGFKSVDYAHAVGLLVEGIKELKRENERLRQRIDKLERSKRSK